MQDGGQWTNHSPLLPLDELLGDKVASHASLKDTKQSVFHRAVASSVIWSLILSFSLSFLPGLTPRYLCFPEIALPNKVLAPKPLP